MKRLNKFTTIAILTIAGIGIVKNANAGGKAFSDLEVSNFQIFQGLGIAAAQWSFSNFGTIAIANDAESHATLTGFPNSNHTQGPTTGNISLPQSYTGLPGGNGNNTYTPTPVNPMLLFSRADSDLNGAIISGVPGGIANAATASSVSEIQIGVGQAPITSSGTDSARIGTASGFTFTLAKPGGLFDFRFDAKSSLETFLDQPQFSSRADYNFNINIKNLATGATVFNWTPSNSITGGTVIAEAFNMNDGCSVVGMQLPIKCSVNNPLGHFEAITTAALNINTPYQLTIQHKTSTSLDVSQVPEPGILSLFASGLLGFAASMQKRYQTMRA